MALDGFSLRQVGLGQDNTSAQMSAKTEHAVKSVKHNDVQNVQASKLTIKEDEKEQNKKKKKKNEIVDGFDENEDEVTEKFNDADSDISVKTYNNYKKNSKKYVYEFSNNVAIRLNSVKEKVELYNSKTNKLLESINTEDFLNLISKLDSASGIMVNKQI